MTQTAGSSVAAPVRHPLAPLTVEEAATACRIALASSGPGTRVVYCALDEPAREAVLGWDGQALPRRALCALYERPARMTWFVTVSLDDGSVAARVPVPGAQPPILMEEWVGGSGQIKADAGFRAAMAKRGITDMAQVQVDPWPASYFGSDLDKSGRRLARGVAYVLDGPGCNPYARPVENLVAVLDRDTGEVVELIDGDVVPVPRDPGRCCTGPAWPRWSCPTGRSRRTTGGRTPSTPATSDWARWPTRSSSAVTAWARSSTWTR